MLFVVDSSRLARHLFLPRTPAISQCRPIPPPRRLTAAGNIAFETYDGLINAAQASPASITIELPEEPVPGREYGVKDRLRILGTGGTPIVFTVADPNGLTIDGQPNFQMADPGDMWGFVYDDVLGNWGVQ